MSAPPPLLAPARKRTLSEDVTERLRQAILSGHFAAEQHLSEEHLARTLVVSRGPIREALLQLEREGLVLSQPNGRALVARLSRKDLEEVYSLRFALERIAVQYAIHNAQDEDFAAMEAVVRSMEEAAVRSVTEQEAADLDIRFHDLLYQSARHDRLNDAWSNLRSQVYVFLLSRNVANPDFREQVMIQGHADILSALRARDEKTAIEQTEAHLRAAYQRIVGNYPSDGGDEQAVKPLLVSLTPRRVQRARAYATREKNRSRKK